MNEGYMLVKKRLCFPALVWLLSQMLFYSIPIFSPKR